MGAIGALFVIVVGTWFLLQSTNVAERIQSYFPGGQEPKDAGAPASAFTPTKWNKKALRISAIAKRGDRVVYDRIMPACSRAGGGFICTSWHRPGAKTTSGTTSCHTHGKGSGKGAMDIVHESGKWGPVDKLEAELKLDNPGEVLFRGVAGHDPELEKDQPHLHAAVNCG